MTSAGRRGPAAALIRSPGRKASTRRRWVVSVALMSAAGLAGRAFARDAFAAREAVLSGEVVAVHDGDTITVVDANREQHRVRLSGIDAPESGQPWGDRSRRALADAVFRRQVRIVWTKRDRYGRVVGKVLQDGRDVCLAQVSAGLAWHFEKYEREQPPQDRQTYRQAQADARGAARGLWQDASPVPPWDFRRERSR